MVEKILGTILGVPGTGKSTAAAMLEEECAAQGKRIKFINDYPFLIEWAEENEGDESKVHWYIDGNGNRNFDIVPAAYQELSVAVAIKIAKEANRLFDACDLVVIESARGAGPDGARDRYREELMEPLLANVRKDVSFAGIEMTVSNIDEVLQRMATRLEGNPFSAPPEIAPKYLENGKPQPAIEGTLGLTGIIFDRTVSNDGDIDEVRAKLKEVARDLVALLYLDLSAEGESTREEEIVEDPTSPMRRR